MEIKKGLYNLNSFQTLFDTKEEDLKNNSVFDSAGGLILGRNLVAVDPDVLTLETPDNTFLSTGITISNVGGYANKIEKLRRHAQGKMTSARDNTTGKGDISLAMKQGEIFVDELGGESSWTTSQIEQASMQGINLVSDLISAQNQVYLKTIDAIGYVGGFGNEGLLNYSGFQNTTSATTAILSTGEALYTEFAKLINLQRAAVNNIPSYSTNTVVMPIEVLNECNKKFLNSTGSMATVLTALKTNFPDVNFMSTFRATKTIAFNSSKQSMQMRIPLPLQIGEIIKRGSFSYANEILARVAGLDVNEDKAGYYLTGL
tara:strand:+ start:843 stop:1793 length:951 start_codon:yes stop_codon:yes gene_type:complete